MPPLPRLTEPVLRDLLDQGRFASRAAGLRQLAATEVLACDIDPDATYPESWLVYRITGFRADAGTVGPDRVLTGAALLAALSPFAIHLSDRARPLASDAPDGVSTVAQLARRWGVSVPTVQRLRCCGLVGRWVFRVGDDGVPGARPTLVFVPAVVAAVEAAHADRLQRAAGFSRLDAAQTDRLVREARRYRERLGVSLHRAAQRLASRHALSVETVRGVLLRSALVKGPGAVFPPPRPPTERDRRVAWRASLRGVPVRDIAERLGRKEPATRRLVLLERAAMLDAWTSWIQSDDAPGEQATIDFGHRVLHPEPVRTDLDDPAPTDLVDLLASLRNAPVPVPYAETARVHASAYLLRSARAVAVACRGSTPPAEAIDAAETALRWSSRLKAALVRHHSGVLHRAWSDTEHAISESNADTQARLLLACLGAMGDAIDRVVMRVDVDGAPPAGRLAGAVALAITRTLARHTSGGGSAGSTRPEQTPERGRARRHLVTGTAVPDWTRAVHPWRASLDPPSRVRDFIVAHAHVESGVDAELLMRRYGLLAYTPQTMDMLASWAGGPSMRVASRVQVGLREAWRGAYRSR